MTTTKKIVRSLSMSQHVSELADKLRGDVSFSLFIQNLILGTTPTVGRQDQPVKKAKKKTA